MGMVSRIRAALAPLKDMDDEGLDQWTRSQYHKYHHVIISLSVSASLSLLFVCVCMCVFVSLSLRFSFVFSSTLVALYVFHSHRGDFENAFCRLFPTNGHILWCGKRSHRIRCRRPPYVVGYSRFSSSLTYIHPHATTHLHLCCIEVFQC